jgi:hypothetical protein
MVETLPPRIRTRPKPEDRGRKQDAGSRPAPPETKSPSDYEVGYKKPPRHTRFKTGQSGNPKGRPKGARNLKTELVEELQEMIRVTESGVRRRVSKQRGVLKSLVAKAVQGDPRAANLVLNLVLRLIAQEEVIGDQTDLGQEDLAILEAYEARIRRRGAKTKEKAS